jgi:hypothetical protein
MIETMSSKLPDEFKEKIDLIDYLISVVNDMEKNKKQEYIEELITTIYINNREITEKKGFKYIERHLIEVKLYKEEIEYSDLKFFINDVVRHEIFQ